MTDELKQFLIDNKPLLVRNDFDTLYKRAASTSGLCKQLTEFLYNVAKLDPLPHMTTITRAMFQGITLNQQLVVPKNIKMNATDDCYINSLTVPVLILECDLEGSAIMRSSIDKIIYKGTSEKVPRNFLSNVNCQKLALPETITRIANSAFNYFDGKIVTPYRSDPAKRLIVPKNEIDWYKEHLRFTHAPKESEVEDGIKEN